MDPVAEIIPLVEITLRHLFYICSLPRPKYFMLIIPPFVQMLSSLFEASAGLSEESLQHMVQALITISGESLQLAYNNREPSLFAIAKLLETGQVGFFSIVLQLAYNNREPSLFAIAKLLETGQVGILDFSL
jgi:hypothetical protein